MLNTTLVTGSRVTCPRCRGFGTLLDADGYPENCVCFSGDPCYIELPVSPEVRDAFGEELMIASGLEWCGCDGCTVASIGCEHVVARAA
jgi:hypothetical protein